MKKPRVTIIVPVYGDWPSLKECIESLRRNVDSRHTVMLVNDCGPDADAIERSTKAAIQDATNFAYHRNDHNLGFVGTCNRAALELDRTSNDIMLLNSDTVVTPGFLDAMLDILYASKKIGVVSPRTNNATIATIPLAAIRNGGIGKGTSFKAFRAMKSKLPAYNIAPTAHGFCMLIKRSVIKEHGLFDTAFGKGYGEEVDLCQRIKKYGYECAIANNAFVYHAGAKSFTDETKKKLIESHDKLIRQRYPDYHSDVSGYINKIIEQERKYLPFSTKLVMLVRNNIKLP